MFYILSKLLAFLLMPSGIILLLLFYILYHYKNRTKVKRATRVLTLFFFLCSSPWLSGKMAGRYEIPVRDISHYPVYDVGVVLTGGIMTEHLPATAGIHLNISGDRIWQALQLYKIRKIRKILISGFDQTAGEKNIIFEAELCRNFLITNGVNPADILLEKKARNTRENAIYSGKILKEKYPEAKILLITSAFHMRRAEACFRKAGMKPDLHSTSFLAYHQPFSLSGFIPSASAFQTTTLLFKEWVGMAVYFAAGYI